MNRLRMMDRAMMQRLRLPSRLARLRGSAGNTLLENILIMIVIGLTIIFMASHFGAVIRARFGAAKSTTDMTKVKPGVHVEVDDQGLTGTAKSVPDP